MISNCFVNLISVLIDRPVPTRSQLLLPPGQTVQQVPGTLLRPPPTPANMNASSDRQDNALQPYHKALAGTAMHHEANRPSGSASINRNLPSKKYPAYEHPESFKDLTPTTSPIVLKAALQFAQKRGLENTAYWKGAKESELLATYSLFWKQGNASVAAYLSESEDAASPVSRTIMEITLLSIDKNPHIVAKNMCLHRDYPGRVEYVLTRVQNKVKNIKGKDAVMVTGKFDAEWELEFNSILQGVDERQEQWVKRNLAREARTSQALKGKSVSMCTASSVDLLNCQRVLVSQIL